ncbi:MAG TPA: peptidylprolyl isomerase [Candidatus Saccharibacteria bacterium]|nr:peptidylprolyl isomerase [Candidatus Saccharibacteria bacterium]
MKKYLKNIKKKSTDYKAAKARDNEPPKTVPVISNKTVPEHRDEVLSSARKFIYPLQHSKHRIVVISISILITAIVFFFTYCVVALYSLQSTSTFIYKVTQIFPFPIARVGRDFVSYENYLFELRRYKHYYDSQQKVDFNTESGRQQLAEYQKRALEKVIDFSYVKELAKDNDISISSNEVDEQIKLLKDQNRLGNGEQVFEDVLKDYFGWSVPEFRRYLEQEMLTQKVVATLDKETQEKANKAYQELQDGKSFAKVAKQYSDDLSTKNSGGEIGFTISRQSKDLTPQATNILFQLKKGEFSKVINTGYSLEIFKLDTKSGDKVNGSHILFNFKDINEYINDLKEKKPAKTYVTF